MATREAEVVVVADDVEHLLVELAAGEREVSRVVVAALVEPLEGRENVRLESVRVDIAQVLMAGADGAERPAGVDEFGELRFGQSITLGRFGRSDPVGGDERRRLEAVLLENRIRERVVRLESALELEQYAASVMRGTKWRSSIQTSRPWSPLQSDTAISVIALRSGSPLIAVCPKFRLMNG